MKLRKDCAKEEIL